MSVWDTIQARRDEILAIADRHGLANVRVYGSVARGEETANSDVDFLINVVAPEKSTWSYIGFMTDVEELLQCEVDVVPETQLHPLLRDEIISHAKPL